MKYLGGFCVAIFISFCSTSLDPPRVFGGDTPLPKLSTGKITPTGAYEAVGTLGGCTATLIDQYTVLTAAHCVCPTDNSPVGCASRATFTFDNVFPVDDPSTPSDESLVRSDVSISGNVRVHPDFGARGWLREDLAILELDSRANSKVKSVSPMPVELPENIPNVGETLTLIGYGRIGSGCSSANTEKRSLDLQVDHSNFAVINFIESGQHTCPGDSGGPIINWQNRVTGVASWTNSSDASYYRPTSFSYSWIKKDDRSGWSGCTRVSVGPTKSHQPDQDWCADGSFLVQIDLDGNPGSAWDTPGIGSARCCHLKGLENEKWEQCQWYPVGLIKSHNRHGGAWCPPGKFLTQLDLDQMAGASEYDSPIVGQARCCALTGTISTQYGSTYWIEVEAAGINSHQAMDDWGVNWGFLTQIDLDGDTNISGSDSPVIGQAKFSRPLLKNPQLYWPMFLPRIMNGVTQ